MTVPTCGVCGKPVADQAYVCSADAADFESDLGDVPAVVDDLRIALIRQAVFSDKLGRGSGQPLPFDPRASEADWVLRNTLTTWARVVVEERGILGPQEDTPAVSRFLLGHVEWFRHHQAGPEAVEEVRSAVREARRVIDRPADRWYAGPCQACGTDLYVKVGKREVVCSECEATYDTTERREWLRAVVEDVLATTTEISRALTTLDVPITASSIRGYVHRKRLEVKGLDHDGHPLYRVGDVLDLIAGERARRSA